MSLPWAYLQDRNVILCTDDCPSSSSSWWWWWWWASTRHICKIKIRRFCCIYWWVWWSRSSLSYIQEKISLQYSESGSGSASHTLYFSQTAFIGKIICHMEKFQIERKSHAFQWRGGMKNMRYGPMLQMLVLKFNEVLEGWAKEESGS